jgi:hypothetical protein
MARQTTPQGDTYRRRVDVDTLDRLADEAYRAASEALDGVRVAQEVERAAEATDAEATLRRFPAVGAPAKAKGAP